MNKNLEVRFDHAELRQEKLFFFTARHVGLSDQGVSIRAYTDMGWVTEKVA